MLTSALLVSFAGLVTMNSFVDSDYYFNKQLIIISVALMACLFVAMFDARFLRKTSVVISIYAISAGLLFILFGLGTISKGAQSWFSFGGFALQPSEIAKIVLIVTLAKYFARRHVEIAHIRHILISGFYAFVLFALIAMQPDFGSAVIIFLIWFGMVLVSGISKKHLLAVFLILLVSFGGLWLFVFQPYQKQRILTFVHPLTDIHGAGYNAFQSKIAVGSGELWGKGLGYGTQSRLQFLPEYETDFIFAAFAEEWGFMGSLVLLLAFAVLIWRCILHSMKASTNFEAFFCLGYAIFITSHIVIHVGMNMGMLPVTGITLPFMSYGGSHLVMEYIGLGLIFAMSNYEGVTYRDYGERELVEI